MRHQAWRASLLVALCACAFGVQACGSSKSSNNGAGASASTATSGGGSAKYEFGTDAQAQQIVDQAFGGGVKLADLPPVAQDAYKIFAKPLTPAEKQTMERCLKTSGKCDLGKGPQATLNVWEAEDTDNPYYKTVRAVNLLEAIREPAVKSITYTNAAFKLPQALANFRSAISEGADIIVGGLSLGDAYLPVVRQAASKGITVWSSTQNIPSAKFDGSDMGGEVIANLCKYGKTLADVALKEGGKKIAMYSGPKGNPYAAQWEPCAVSEIKKGGGQIVVNGDTSWTPQGEQQAAAALAAQGLPDALIYDYAPQAFIQKFVSLGKTPPTQVGGSQTFGSFRAWKDANQKGFKFKSYIASSEILFAAVNLHAAVVQHTKAGDVPRKIVLPQTVIPIQDVAKYYNPSFPAGGNFGSGLPDDILKFAFSV